MPAHDGSLSFDTTLDTSGLQEGLSQLETIMKSPLAKVTKAADDMMQGLVDAFAKGGLEGLAAEFGTVLGDAVSEIAGFAPQMARTGVTLIQSLLNGITQNADRITQGAAIIINSLVRAIIQLAPEIYDAASVLVSKLAGALFGPGLEMSVSIFMQKLKGALAGIFTSLAGILDKLLPVVAVLLEKIDEVIAAYAVWTAAQTILNLTMKANPIGAVISAIQTLISVIALLGSLNAAQKTDADILKEKTDKRIEQLRDEKDAYDELRSSCAKQASEDLAQVDRTEGLSAELKRLVDANGKVTDANKDRVKYILGELNTAYGKEYKMIGNSISGYQEMQGEIDNLVQKRRYEVLQKATLPIYEKAITDEMKSRMAAAADLMNLEAQRTKVEELEAKHRQLVADGYSAYFVSAKIKEREALEEQIEAEKGTLKGLETAYSSSMGQIGQLVQDRQTIEAAAQEASKGNYQGAIDCLSGYTSGVREAMSQVAGDTQKQKQVIAQYYAESIKALQDYLQRCKDGEETRNEERVNELLKNAKDAKQAAQKIGINIVNGQVEGIDGQKLAVGTTLEALEGLILKKTADELGIVDGKPSTVMCEKIGKPLVAGIVAGIQARGEDPASAVIDVINWSVKQGQKVGIIKSPSRLTRDKIGKPLVEGIAVGIRAGSDDVGKAFGEAMEVIDLQHDLGILSDEQYYKELERLRDKYLPKGTEAWWDATQKIIKYEQDAMEKVKGEITDTFEEMLKDADKALEEIQKKMDKVSDKLKKYGELYEMVTVDRGEGKEPLEYMQLNNFEDDIKALERYRDALMGVKNRGADADFFAVLTEMDVDEVTMFANQLNAMSDAEFNQYMLSWKKKQELANEIGKNFYQDEAEQVGKEFSDKIGQEIDKVPEQFKENGKLSAQAFGEGLLEEIEKIMVRVRAMVALELGNVGVSLTTPSAAAAAATPAPAASTVPAETPYSTYNSNININAAGMTTAQMRAAMEQTLQLQKMRYKVNKL